MSKSICGLSSAQIKGFADEAKKKLQEGELPVVRLYVPFVQNIKCSLVTYSDRKIVIAVDKNRKESIAEEYNYLGCKAGYVFDLMIESDNGLWTRLGLRGKPGGIEVGNAYSWHGTFSIQKAGFEKEFVRFHEFEKDEKLLIDVRKLSDRICALANNPVTIKGSWGDIALDIIWLSESVTYNLADQYKEFYKEYADNLPHVQDGALEHRSKAPKEAIEYKDGDASCDQDDEVLLQGQGAELSE